MFIIISFAKQEEIQKLKCEQQWIGVVDQETFLAEVKTTLDSSIAKKEEIIKSVQNSATSEQKQKDQCMALKAEIDAKNRVAAAYDAKFNEMRENFKNKNEIYLQKARELKRVESKRDRIASDIAKLKDHIENHAHS